MAVGCGAAGNGRNLPLDQIDLPPGFTVTVFADNLPRAREMALGADGTVFVGSRGSRVYALRDHDGDGRAERRFVVADGLRAPNGVAVRGGDLYVAEISRIRRYADIAAHLDDPPPGAVVVDDLPDERHHGYRFIRFGPDGRLYVPIGQPCNVCNRSGFGVLLGMDADGGHREVFAQGIRNSVGFDWRPETGVLWFTDNGRDWLGDNRPPDELNRAPKPGLHFGFPFCHGGDIPDPKYGAKRPCSAFTAPVQKLGPHVAALGMRFYDGRLFPSAYRGDIFIAEHGSWNRSDKIGYRVTRVHLENGKVRGYHPFATGWLQGQSDWGRPVDVLVAKDGALLVSDDANGVIYRIGYR